MTIIPIVVNIRQQLEQLASFSGVRGLLQGAMSAAQRKIDIQPGETTMFVSYVRVSTQKQGQSGLGREAQQEAVRRFAADRPIVAEFVEVESGKKADRPQLRAALAECRRTGATLLIAKLDRLARNVAFVSALMESGTEFVAADMPDANKLTIHVISAMAEHEARCISERTKSALAAYKARGGRLGGARDGGQYQASLSRGRASNAARASEARDRVYSLCLDLRNAGRSLQSIANELNGSGERTRRGGLFGPVQVHRILGGRTGGHAGRF
jgi:DNA invertase Pin-like site-specific DNA recombinase